MGLLFVLPTVLAVLAVNVYPLLEAIRFSFQDNKIRNQVNTFIGFGNYAELFSRPETWHSLGISAIFVIATVALSYAAGLGTAVLLNRPLRGRAVLRAAIIVPWAIPAFVAALTWAWMFNDQFGIINGTLQAIGITRPPVWLGTSWALASLVLVMVWKSFPFQFVMLLAGLQGIPNELYESASIDGAGRWRQLTSITVPMLAPVSSIALLLAAINAFHYFPIPWILTEGGPSNATNVIPIFTYQTAFAAGDFGLGSAAAVVMFLLILLAAIPYLRYYYRRLGSS